MLLHKFQYLPGDYGVGANLPFDRRLAIAREIAAYQKRRIKRIRRDSATEWRATLSLKRNLHRHAGDCRVDVDWLVRPLTVWH